ncbi:condensation domain-containing protein [Streptomyces sp. NBC_01445]|uniref:condensation domain-containing protein n=1 Tax=Streptomyces sp. NBC_01445 TaxID=2903869 RepID=UPI002DDA1ECB|nr:condensation domain-containing protein [Streptomyces sp. NBC_01445]WSE11686.1 condensation domain-containing protein [Streptomyces sp. NBC_01445]
MAVTLKDDFAERARLEARLLARRRGGAALPLLDRPAGAEWHFAASLGQEGMWPSLATTARQPLIVGGLRVSGPLDTGALREAWQALAERHETLRSAYRTVDGALTQVVPVRARPVMEVALADPAAAASVADDELARPFDFGRGPLARLRVLRRASGEHLVVVCLHHLVGDARALEVVTTELTALYAGAVTGSPVQLPELPAQYADFAAWHRARVEGEHGGRTVAYWLDRLAGAEPAALPCDRSQDPSDIAGHTRSFPLPPELFARLREVAARHRTTFYVVGLAAFQILLARWSGERDICVRAPVSYRDRSDVHGLVGDFSNDVVVRADLSGHVTLAEAVEQVRASTADDFAHHDIPPHVVASRMADPTLLERLFHVQFTAEREHDLGAARQLGPIRAEPFSPTAETVARPLSVRLRHDDHGGRVIVAYRSGLFSDERARALQRDYFALFEEIAAHPGRPAVS